MNSRNVYLCALFLIVLSLSSSLFLPLLRGESPIRLGPDLKGGVVVTYRPDFSSVLDSHQGRSRSEILALAKDNLSARLQRTLNLIPDVVVRGDETIAVTLPADGDHRETLALVGKTHQLTLRLVVSETERATGEPADAVNRHAYGARLLELAPAEFHGGMLDERKIRVESGSSDSLDLSDLAPKIGFGFKPPHDKAFHQFTGEHAGEPLAILLDDQVEWVGTISGPILGNAVLAGNYTLEQATEISMMLKAGSLPVSLQVEELTAVGPLLGQAIRNLGGIALGLALAGLALLLFVAYLHRGWFIVASTTSLACLLFLIAGIAATFDLTLDVVGIAGIILSVGMGMDACILVLESLENRLPTYSVRSVATNHRGIARAAYSFANQGRTLFHANATTLLVVALLLATERLRSFALFMIAGIAASLLTILITREILPRVYGWFPDLRFDTLGWLRTGRFGIFRWRKAYLATVLSGFVLTLAIVLGTSMFTPGTAGGEASGPGLRLGPDFRPGVQVTAHTDTPELENALIALRERLPGAGIQHQTLGPPELQRHIVTVGTTLQDGVGNEPRDASGITSGELLGIFNDASVEVEGIDSIDDRVSGRRMVRSLSVLLGSFVLLGLYLVVLQEPLNDLFSKQRRPPSSRRAQVLVFLGIALAIVLDVGIMLAVLALLSAPVSLAIVAGFLAVIGYSVNDSVVLWCHIQDQQARQAAASREDRRGTPLQWVSEAIDRIASRAALTTLSTALPAVMILVVGLTPLVDFAWVVLAGTLAGTLSSMFVVGSFALRALEPRHSPGGAPRVDKPQTATVT